MNYKAGGIDSTLQNVSRPKIDVLKNFGKHVLLCLGMLGDFCDRVLPGAWQVADEHWTTSRTLAMTTLMICLCRLLFSAFVQYKYTRKESSGNIYFQ